MDSNDVIRILDDLGDRLSPYAEAAWTLLVTQKRIEGIVYAVLDVVVILIVVYAGIGFYRKLDIVAKDTDNYNYADRDVAALAKYFFAVIPVIVALGLLSWCASNIMTAIVPEYYVLQDLISQVR